MSTVHARLQMRRGTEAELPSSGYLGELYVSLDTHKLWVWDGAAMAPIASAGASQLDDLTDVTISSPSSNQFLRYNGSAWVNSTYTPSLALDDLTDVAILSAARGHMLQHDGAGWVNGFAGKFTTTALPVVTPASAASGEMPSNINATEWVQDEAGVWHAYAGMDINTDNFQKEDGVKTIFQKTFIRDNNSKAQTFKNAMLSINHTPAAATDYSTQDRGLAIETSNITGTVVAFSISSNVVTMNLSLTSGWGTGNEAGFRPLMRVRVTGMVTGTYLNSVDFTVQTVSVPSGSNTQVVTLSDPGFTHADVTTTADSGSVDQVVWSMTCAQMQLDIYGKPISQGSPDGEWTCLSLQLADFHQGDLASPNQYGPALIRSQYYRQAGTGSWTGGRDPALHRIVYTNNSDEAMGTFYGERISSNNFGNPPSGTWIGAYIEFPGNLGRYPTANIGLKVADYGSNASDYAIQVVGGKCSFGGNVSIGGQLTAIGSWPSQTANLVLAGPTSGGSAAATFRSLVAADLPVMVGDSGSGGTRGAVPAPAAGDAAAGKFLKADGTWAVASGGGGSVNWDAIGSATSSLTLNNAGNATTFNQTSAVNWTWENTTAATNGGVVSSSPIFRWIGHNFTSTVDTKAIWTLQGVHGSAIASSNVTNAVENASSQVTLTLSSHSFTAGMWITLQSMSTYTWLNGQNARITSTTATTIVFTDPTAHGTQGSVAQTGTVIQIPAYDLNFSVSGTAGEKRILFPVGAAPSLNTGGVSWAWATSGANEGFWCPNSSTSGLSIGLAGPGTPDALQFYIPSAAGGNPTQHSRINIGNNSVGNQTIQVNGIATNTSVELRGNCSTNVTNPAVMFSSSSSLTATSGTQIGYGFGYVRGASTGMTFAPTSGTAIFQALVNKYIVNQTGGANGAVTGLLVNAVETAVGGTHLLVDLQAGTTGGTSQFAINNVGKVTKYNAISTVGYGVPAEFAEVNLTAQSAAIAATTLYAVPAGASGMYRISWTATITTAATTSSVLGGANGFQTVFTSPTDSVVKTTVVGNSVTSAGNTTGTAIGGCEVVYAKAGTNIQYSFDYTSVGGTAMQYELHVKCEAM